MRTRNLEAFRTYLPDLHARLLERLDATNGDGASELPDHEAVSAENLDAVDVEIDRSLRAFRENPTRFLLPPLTPGPFDRYTNRFIARLTSRAKKAAIPIAPSRVGRDAYFLAVIGIGSGRHIRTLTDETDCQMAIVIDEDVDGLYRSLVTCDWKGLIENLATRGRRLNFLIESDPERMAEDLRCFLRMDNPSAVDGFSYFVSEESAYASTLLTAFRRDQSLLLAGLGFFYDETLMLRNAHGNLKSGEARIYLRPENEKLALPAFVVASGPSLDDDLSWIRDNAEKAVIISCGSALRPLLKSGVVPDFQVEMENIGVFPLMKSVADEFDLSRVCVIAAATVDQVATRYFGSAVYFFRSVLSPFPLFCDSGRTCISYPDPTVANGGFSFALEIGAREVYLVGVDTGKRADKDHHSKLSYHYLPGAVPDYNVFDMEVEANFGGTCLTSVELFWGRRQLEAAIAEFSDGRLFFNCSDGAAIEGARPFRAAELSLPAPPREKGAEVERIFAGFPTFTNQRFDACWDVDGLEDEVDRFVEQVQNCLEPECGYPDKRYLAELMEVLRPDIGFSQLPPSGKTNAVRMLFRGSLIMMVIAQEHFRGRIAETGHKDKFAAIAREELRSFLSEMADYAREIIRNPDADLPFETDDVEDVRSVVAEVDYTWGKVSRNAPCPCGSGRKYKHCHGKLK